MAEATSETQAHDIFISYSHADKAQVRRLARKLSRYRRPHPWWSLPWPPRLSVFLDEDQAAGTVLSRELKDALNASSTLVVACSPTARRSAYVTMEIDEFRSGRTDANIVPVLVAGLPNDEAVRIGRPEDAAFPDALTAALDGDPWPSKFLGKDAFRRANRHNWYHLLAAIHRTDRKTIEDRERVRRRRRARLAMTLAAMMLLGLAGFWWREQTNFERLVDSRYWADSERLFESAPDLSLLFSAFALENSSTMFVQQRARLLLSAGLESYPLEAGYSLESGRINSLAWTRSGILVAAGDNGTYTMDVPNPVVPKTKSKFFREHLREHPTDPLVAQLNSQGGLSLFNPATREDQLIGPRSEAGGSVSWCRSDGEVWLFSDSGPLSLENRLLRWRWKEPERRAEQLWNLKNTNIDAFDVHPACESVALVVDGALHLTTIQGRDLAPPVKLQVSVSRLRWSPDGRTFVTTDSIRGESKIRRWTLDEGRLREWSFANGTHNVAISDVAWSPNGEYLATVSHDGILKTWTFDWQRMETAHKADNEVLAVAWSPKNDAVATGSFDGRVKIWRAGSGKTTQVFERNGHRTSMSGTRVTVGHAGAMALYGMETLSDSEGRPITDAELTVFVRRRVGRPLTDDECLKILGLVGCQCPRFTNCRNPRPSLPD
jgi:WD40 repeat protein